MFFFGAELEGRKFRRGAWHRDHRGGGPPEIPIIGSMYLDVAARKCWDQWRSDQW